MVWVSEKFHILHVGQEALGLEVVHQHHQISVAREVSSAFAREAISFQEEEPEIGEW